MEASFTESWAGEHEGDPCLGWQAERVLASLTQNALKWPQENPQQASAKTPTRGAGDTAGSRRRRPPSPGPGTDGLRRGEWPARGHRLSAQHRKVEKPGFLAGKAE